ncbi:MAG: hypothetical protein LBS60_03145 [Deltaproteobacteria bacterium]|jgi:hypothetical protein|nr:hypothetical protein [Deltaproteobacteria bacterium]
MSFNGPIFAVNLQRYRALYNIDPEHLAARAGLSSVRLALLMAGQKEPTGAEVLIFSDIFLCDYNDLISDKLPSSIILLEEFFKKYTNINDEDRINILEFLFLSECQDFLDPPTPFDRQNLIVNFKKFSAIYKEDEVKAAQELRLFFNYKTNEIKINVFNDFRQIGLTVWRRRLDNSHISSLYIQGPASRPSILVNYAKDVFSQRFATAFAVGRTLGADGPDNDLFYDGSLKEPQDNLVNQRANKFALEFLVPKDFLSKIPHNTQWAKDKIIKYSKNALVNPLNFLDALFNAHLISKEDKNLYSNLEIANEEKIDPEFIAEASPELKERKLYFLQRGLSSDYVSLGFKAYRNQLISAGKLTEMLLCNEPNELWEISKLYHENLD